MSGNGSNRGTEIDLDALLKPKKRKLNLSDEERERRRQHLSKVQASPEQKKAGARKGAAVTHARNKERKEIQERFIENALRERADEMIDRLIKPYFEALDLEPDPKWSPMTKLNFFLEQTVAAEKVASRLEGLPVARRREVDADGNDRQRVAELPSRMVERALQGAFAAGRFSVDSALELSEDTEFEIEVDAEEVDDGS